MSAPKTSKSQRSLVLRVAAVAILIVLGIFAFLASEEPTVKIVTPLAVAFWSFVLFSSYFHEKKDDKDFKFKSINWDDDALYKSLEWTSSYEKYKAKNPFKKIQERSMRKDLFKRSRNKSKFVADIVFGALIGIFICSISQDDEEILLALPFVALYFSYKACKDFSAKSAKTFLNRRFDYDKLEDSYLNGKLLTHKSSGLILGKTHVHLYTKNKIFAIDYRIVENITRRVEATKRYLWGIIYNDVVYTHFAVLHLSGLENGIQVLLNLELNEFQVQMAIEEFVKLKSERLSVLTSEKHKSYGQALSYNGYDALDFEENLKLMRSYYKERPLRNKTLPRPQWLTPEDPLFKIYDDKQILFEKGEIYYAQIVQANEILFNPNSNVDAPASVIFSTNPIFNKFPYLLKFIAEKLYSYKDANLEDIPGNFRKLAEIITSEKDRTTVDFTAPLELDSRLISTLNPENNSIAPTNFTSVEFRFTTVTVFRKDVPRGAIAGPLFPIVAAPDRCESALILPKEYWSIDFSNWKGFL